MLSLVEKLRLDFAIELPSFDGSSVEIYLAEVARVVAKKNWRVRRQVAIGVFPSARMAMYHDLDSSQPGFPQSDIVQSLLIGSEATGASPFADEYEIDQPEIEAKVPCVVMDADSSQFSVLVDIADGKNLAVEGPPGTGKSQTIVNAIAAALAGNKKVLFVAEKLAALNVVKSRLEAVGLGEFLLPLQAEKSTREQVIESIRARLDARDSRAVRDYDGRIEEFRRVRSQLADYIQLVTTEFGRSGLTVHKILGKSIVTNDTLSAVRNETLESCRLDPASQTAHGFSTLVQYAVQLEKAHAATLVCPQSWRETRLMYPDRFTVEEACAVAEKASEEALSLAQARDALVPWGIDPDEGRESWELLRECLARCSEFLRQHPRALVLDLLAADKADLLIAFLEDCTALSAAERALSSELSEQPSEQVLQQIQKLEDICTRASLSTIDHGELVDQIEAKRASAATARSIAAALGPLVAACEAARTWLLDDIAKAHALYRSAGREALSLRIERLSEDNAAYHLRILCEEGRQLQRERDAISEQIVLSVETPLADLVGCVSIIRASGSLSFLSPSFRSARRLWKSISRSGIYSKPEAILALDKLIAFRRKTDEFTARANASGLFGIHYRGLDTGFEPFERIVRYLDHVAEAFGEPEHASLHAFLRDAPVKRLDLLPALPSTGVPITFVSLGGRIATAEDEAAVLEGILSELKAVACALKTTEVGPDEVQDIRRRLEDLLSGRSRVDSHDAARELLGGSFAGHRTQAEHFEPLALWARSVREYAPRLRMILLSGDPAEACGCLDAALSADAKLTATLERLAHLAKVDPASFLSGRTLVEAAAVLKSASSEREGLFAFANFASVLLEGQSHGIMPLVEEGLRAGSLAGLGAQVEALATRHLAKAVFAQFGSQLTRYHGAKLDDLRAELAQKDREIIQLSRQQLRAKVKADARPPMGNGIGRKSTWTDMALIENELSKKQKFIPVRDMTQRAGKALLELKPCWMMSPLAVAQYVPKGNLRFDLCIIDEASQMPPESAIGALLRCSQTVVVGDTNQLPPSSFFRSLVDEEDADEDEAVLNESVLEMANGSFRPARRLRWHYRSRHSGLIRFSNRIVYDDHLIVFPSATESVARMGVEFRSIKGRYKAGTNPVEAKAIIEAIIEFMQTDADRSLGVVTLNQKQRDLIMEEFEYAVANNRAVQKYVDTWKEKNDGLEEFFVKNLENVQGDERDVIFIGTVYGAEEPGARVMQRFGPINGLAGKRRLNVLFTRAKQKIITFSSMTAADIEAEENTNPGAYMLKRWLEYAASGVLDSGDITQREPDSDFEIFVIDQIKAMGCTPVPQVGVVGYSVDIGIRHPEWPHGFILGVECDGASYHSAKSARDRDRLRQEILEGLGWKLHRIWSTDWFNNPRQEAERLRKVIADRLAVLKAREHEYIGRLIENGGAVPPDAEVSIAAPAIVVDDPVVAAVERAPQKPIAKPERRVEIGDRVRVRYLTDDKRTINVTISKHQSDTSRGIIHHRAPVATALLGMEEGDEVEVLAGSYIRKAVVENIVRGFAEGDDAGVESP